MSISKKELEVLHNEVFETKNKWPQFNLLVEKFTQIGADLNKNKIRASKQNSLDDCMMSFKKSNKKDEFDFEEDFYYKKIDSNTFLFDGKTSLNDLCKVLNIHKDFFDASKGESESLGGLILELNSKIPSVGDKIKFDNFIFTIMSVDNKRIKRVRVFKKTKG